MNIIHEKTASGAEYLKIDTKTNHIVARLFEGELELFLEVLKEIGVKSIAFSDKCVILEEK